MEIHVMSLMYFCHYFYDSKWNTCNATTYISVVIFYEIVNVNTHNATNVFLENFFTWLFTEISNHIIAISGVTFVFQAIHKISIN